MNLMNWYYFYHLSALLENKYQKQNHIKDYITTEKHKAYISDFKVD